MLQVGLEERLENAQRVLAKLDRYAWPEEWPAKPGMASFDDEIVDAWKVILEGGKPPKEAREDLRLFVTWRQSVMAVESNAIGALQLLVACVNVFELAHWDPQAEEVRAFIERQYRCRLPVPCPDAHTDWVRRYAERFGQNRELLPLHLRRMTRPPKNRQGVPLPPEQGELDV
jgi:hypothetical protein